MVLRRKKKKKSKALSLSYFFQVLCHNAMRFTNRLDEVEVICNIKGWFQKKVKNLLSEEIETLQMEMEFAKDKQVRKYSQVFMK